MRRLFLWEHSRYVADSFCDFIRRSAKKYRKRTILVSPRVHFIVTQYPSEHIPVRLILKQYAPDGEWKEGEIFDISKLPLEDETERRLRLYLSKYLDEYFRARAIDQIKIVLKAI